jgi:hypothetical protein
VLVLVVLAPNSPAAAARQTAVATGQEADKVQGVALSHFEQRAKDYMALRDNVKASLAPPRPNESAQELTARQRGLARGVRAARASAKPGDVFIPEVASVIRKVIREDFAKRTAHERAAALREVPAGLVLKINDEYPKSIPLATVPPKLLAALPPLPDGLEYRFVGRQLILHDTVTNLVVDILESAVPRQ